MKSMAKIAIVPVALACLIQGAAAEEATIKIGMVRTITAGNVAMGIEKGYFKDAGINLEIEVLNSSATALASLAQNQFQAVMGGISAGYFNALEKGLPVTMTISRASTPIRHNIMLRPDLVGKIKSAKDLKGKVIGSNAPGSISTYEIGKVMEKVGMSIKDVEIKNIPFTQYGLAFKNKAIDAALAISPFTSQLETQGLAVPFIETDDVINPRPLTVSTVFLNTDWAKENPKLAQKFMTALLRGVRDYCQAYHHGPNRQEMIDVLIKSGTERRPQILNEFPWPARSVYGDLSVESLLDVQRWYKEAGMIDQTFPAERLVDTSYAANARKELGDFHLTNTKSDLPSCGKGES